MVTGADESLGAAVVAALLAEDVPEIRATVAVRAAAPALVERGVRTAALDVATADAERLGAVVDGAHTVIHVAGEHPARTLAQVLEAVEATSVRRVVVPAVPPEPSTAAASVEVVVVDAGLSREALVAALLAADRRV